MFKFYGTMGIEYGENKQYTTYEEAMLIRNRSKSSSHATFGSDENKDRALKLCKEYMKKKAHSESE